MGKKKGGRKMNATAKVIDMFSRSNNSGKRGSKKYTQVKPIKKLSDKDMKASQQFINDSWERE